MKHIYIKNILSIHVFTTKQLFWHSSAPRNVHFLAYHEFGENQHFLSDKVLNVSHETLLFLNKKDDYNVKIIEKSPAICIALDFDADIESFALNCSECPQIKTAFKNLLAHRNIDIQTNFLSCMSTIYEIFTLVENLKNKPYQINEVQKLLENASSYIKQHYTDEKISNEYLASLCGISTRYFILLFKNKYGETPQKYILHKKINEASKLLLTQLYNIKQVSEMTGFSDVYCFSKTFKKHMRISPNKYKKNNCL